jgi:hypothetical protein
LCFFNGYHSLIRSLIVQHLTGLKDASGFRLLYHKRPLDFVISSAGAGVRVRIDCLLFGCSFLFVVGWLVVYR